MMDSVEKQDVIWWRKCFTGRLASSGKTAEASREVEPAR